MSNLPWSRYYSMMSLSRKKYAFYEGNFSYSDLEGSKLARKINRTKVGWGRRAIDMRANKTHFDRFENDDIGLNEVFNKYHAPDAFKIIKEDILVCGVGFLAKVGDRVLPFTALEATGSFDWAEQNLGKGVAVLERSKVKGMSVQPPATFMEFTKTETVTTDSEGTSVLDNNVGRPMMSMLTHKHTTKQPMGRSVLVSSARDAIIDASRIRRQSMIAGYHYNTKVDVLLGVDSETEVDKIEAQTGDILKVGVNENNEIPRIGQFAQHAMTPFTDSLMMAARDFCTDTKLNLNNLNFSSNAPQNPEALEIVGDDLRDDILEWQKEVGEQLKYFAVTLWMFDRGLSELDPETQRKINDIEVAWLPIFRADVSKFGDGLNKIAQNAPAIVTQRSIWRNLGLTSREVDDVVSSARAEKQENIL